LENRVLLVEDEAPLRRSLEKFLERAGYTFDSCATAREALVLAGRVDYGITLVEYHLPDANGVSLLEKLRRLIPNVVTIMISQYDFQAVADDLVRENVRFYLKKPFDLTEFEAALKNGTSIQDADWAQELGLEGMPASVLK
jgi:DNA-binding response OmpR family regulator